MTDDDWKSKLANARQTPPRVLSAHTYLRTRFASISGPALFACDEGVECVVKPMSPALQRAMVNDQVVGRVGKSVAAPVATVELIDVPKPIIDAQSELAGFAPGVSHGSHYMSDVSKTREPILHIHVGGNRKRFAELALLYGLAFCQHDHQFFYQDGTKLVFSFDHGHFFPDGPGWSVAGLQSASKAAPDTVITGSCQLTGAELQASKELLDRLTDEMIAAAISAVPKAWGLSGDEELALAKYLHTRRDELKGALGGQTVS